MGIWAQGDSKFSRNTLLNSKISNLVSLGLIFELRNSFLVCFESEDLSQTHDCIWVGY